jgi:hypothetical protein
MGLGLMRLLVFLLFAVSGSAFCQQQDIQRALIQRDQQSAEFAAQLRGSQDLQRLQTLDAAQLRDALVPLSPDPGLAAQLLPYQRGQMAQERDRELRFAPPVVRGEALRGKSGSVADLHAPLPLPGGPGPGVDLVTPEGIPR